MMLRAPQIPDHLKQYFIPAEIGLEPTIEAFVSTMVEVFREVRRVLHPSGLLWVNLGDSYSGSGCGPNGKSGVIDHETRMGTVEANGGRHRRLVEEGALGDGYSPVPDGMKPKDIMLVPFEVAKALRSDGWYFRDDIIWHKANSQPSSVKDRPKKVHEYLFLFSKSRVYFYDWFAARRREKLPGFEVAAWIDEFLSANLNARQMKKWRQHVEAEQQRILAEFTPSSPLTTVWTIAMEAFAGMGGKKHYASFPSEIARRPIVAATSEHGACAQCNAPYRREVEPSEKYAEHLGPGKDWAGDDRKLAEIEGRGRFDMGGGVVSTQRRTKRNAPTLTAEYRHVGWSATCKCNAARKPCVVLDPFGGSGTTMLVAEELGRDWIGIDINPDYCEMAAQRIGLKPSLLNPVAAEIVKLEAVS